MPSAICTARAPTGRPWNLSLVSVTALMRVEQVLGLDPADQGVGEVPLVARVALVALGRPLIGPRVADVAHQRLEVVLGVGEVLAQGLEQLGVGGRVADPEVVDRLDDARRP